MYLVYVYICPVYGYSDHSNYSVKKYIVMDEKTNLGIDGMSERIDETKTKVTKLINNDGIIAL